MSNLAPPCTLASRSAAAVSIVSAVFIVFLIISEFSLYRTVESVDKVMRMIVSLSSLTATLTSLTATLSQLSVTHCHPLAAIRGHSLPRSHRSLPLQLSVDVSTGEKLQINVDFTFPHMPCSRKLRHLVSVVLSVHGAVLSLDVMDVSGEQHLDVDHNVFKKNIDSEGKQIGAIEKHGACAL